MYIGYDHAPKNLIPEADIVQHRLDFALDFTKTDAQLRHDLMYTKHRDNIIYTNSISLSQVLAQCKDHNIIPVIALNFFWAIRHKPETKHLWTSKITPVDMGRAARLVNDLITEAGFTKAYLSVLNEPTKWLNNEQIYQYSKAVVDNTTIGILIGNDEFFPEMFDYLASRFTGNSRVIIGYHALSSMGNWGKPNAYIGRISMMKGMASNYGLDIIGNECGTWFVSYREQEGHEVNKEIILECKKHGYKACLIVLPEMNINCINRYKLGYRIWDNEYRNIMIDNGYFGEFIKLIKEHGNKYTEFYEEEDMKLKVLKVGSKGNQVEWLQVILETEYGYENEGGADGVYGTKTKAQVMKYQKDNGLAEDGLVGKKTMAKLINEAGAVFTPTTWMNTLRVYMAYE